jgi:SNF2 family DNA or RNA helicase
LLQSPIAASVRLECQEAGIDWFDLQVVLDVSQTELTKEELKLLLNARGRFVRLGDKGWRRLEYNLTEEQDAKLAKLGLATNEFSAEPQRLHALQLADNAASELLSQKQFEQIRSRVDEIKMRVTPPVPDSMRAELRSYQLEGFHFLSYLAANRFGGILADDMGLGKTVQALTWLIWLRQQNASGPKPVLVVCPKSVVDNWQSEAERFAPGLRVQVWRGRNGDDAVKELNNFDVFVINYAQLRAMDQTLAKVPWQTVILDEGQYIKNPDSQTAQAARALKSDHRLVLSGTPIENRLLDLWSLMSFAMPGMLGNRASFAKNFGDSGDKLARSRLAARVRPFLLRRTKNQVASELPDRIEEDILCEMEGEQRTLYRAELKRAQQMLLQVKTKQELNEARFSFLTSLLRLRQICCHPGLVNAKLKSAESSKLEALLDLLEPLMQEGNKVLVFSQFVTMLDIVRKAVKARGWQHFYLAGDTENRGDLVKEFQNAAGSAVFLISLKAGGFGLNLTAASYVVLFDPWWNPAVENQAIDRTHRIGQINKVIAYRLLIKDSIEGKIRALQKQKSALAHDVLGEEGFASSLSLDDLKYLFSEDQ